MFFGVGFPPQNAPRNSAPKIPPMLSLFSFACFHARSSLSCRLCVARSSSAASSVPMFLTYTMDATSP